MTLRPTGRPPVWVPLMEPLMSHPGEVDLIRFYERPRPARIAVSDLRKAIAGLGSTVVPPGRWEVWSAQCEPDVPGWGVYGRYLGPAEHQEEEHAA